MSVSYDVTGTLRAQEHGHPPVIVWSGKADGAAGGGVAFSIVGNHDDRPTDMTNLVVVGNENIHRNAIRRVDRN